MFSNAPPADSRFMTDVYRVKPGGHVKFVSLCRSIRGLYTHYDQQKTVACSNDARCNYCVRNYERKWTGWLIARQMNGDRRVLMNVTHGAALQIEDWRRKNGHLLGVIIELQRKGSLPNGPLSATCLARIDNTQEVPLQRLESAVRALYGLDPSVGEDLVDLKAVY